MGDLVYEDLRYKIRGAVFEVYKQKGCGFLEDVYQECMEIELGRQRIEFLPRHPLNPEYKGHTLTKKYVPDLICCGNIVVEIKAAKEIVNEHRAQLQNYLRATGYKLGLLVNFGHYPKVQIERIVN